MLFSHRPDWSNEIVRAALQNTAEDLGEDGWDRFFGAGRIDAARALQAERVARSEIFFPFMDSGFSSDVDHEVVIRGTVLGAFVKSYELAYGIGDDPKYMVFQ